MAALDASAGEWSKGAVTAMEIGAMCYSAMIYADWLKFLRVTGADMSYDDFVDKYWSRQERGELKIPKGVDLGFLHPKNEQERQIKALIDAYDAQQVTKLEQELFQQTRRLNDAERALKVKETKKALNEQRIAGNKIEAAKRRLADLRRTEPEDRDSRIFPQVYAPVMVSENGRRTLKLMRYGCRPAGKPASYDKKYPGTYNARRDNLEGFWKGQFGHSHGIIIVDTFFENVEIDGKNQVLQFTPDDGEPMFVACLWSHWSGKGEPDLDSFAMITDEPPPEVSSAGHDRCIINIKPENIDAWLNPDPTNLEALYAILDDKAKPHYEHRLAA